MIVKNKFRAKWICNEKCASHRIKLAKTSLTLNTEENLTKKFHVTINIDRNYTFEVKYDATLTDLDETLNLGVQPLKYLYEYFSFPNIPWLKLKFHKNKFLRTKNVFVLEFKSVEDRNLILKSIEFYNPFDIKKTIFPLLKWSSESKFDFEQISTADNIMRVSFRSDMTQLMVKTSREQTNADSTNLNVLDSQISPAAESNVFNYGINSAYNFETGTSTSRKLYEKRVEAEREAGVNNPLLEKKKNFFINQYKPDQNNSNLCVKLTVCPENFFANMCRQFLMIRKEQMFNYKWIFNDNSGAVDNGGVTNNYLSKFLDKFVAEEFSGEEDGIGLLYEKPKSRDGLKTSARSFIPVYFCIMKCIQFNIPLPDTISDAFYKVFLGIPLSFSDLEIFDPRTYKNITQPLEKEESSLSLIMENIEKTLIYHRPGMLELQAMFSPLGEYNDFSKNLRSCFSFNEFKFLFVGKVNFIATDLIKAFRNISDQNSNEDQFIWFKEWLATLKNGELRKIWFEITATFTFNSSIELGYLTIQQLPIENLPTTRSCFKKLEVPAYTDKDLMCKRFNIWLNNIGGKFSMA